MAKSVATKEVISPIFPVGFGVLGISSFNYDLVLSKLLDHVFHLCNSSSSAAVEYIRERPLAELPSEFMKRTRRQNVETLRRVRFQYISNREELVDFLLYANAQHIVLECTPQMFELTADDAAYALAGIMAMCRHRCNNNASNIRQISIDAAASDNTNSGATVRMPLFASLVLVVFNDEMLSLRLAKKYADFYGHLDKESSEINIVLF